MSFYAGRERVGTVTTRQCHITKGQHDIETMKGPPVADTVFHSDIKYVTYHMFNYTSSIRDANSDLSMFYYSTEALNLVNAGYAYMFLDRNGRCITNGASYNYWYKKGIVWTIEPSPFSGMEGSKFPYYENPRLIVFNFKFNGILTPAVETASDIRIDKNQFIVNGINIVEQKYINSVRINNVDYTSQGYTYTNPFTGVTDDEWTGEFSFINSVEASGESVKFTSNNTVTKIENDGKVIITSEYGAQKVQVYSVKYIPSASWYTSGGLYGPIGTGYSTGDLIYIALRLPFLDTQDVLRYHDIQRIVQWQAGSTTLPIEIRLFSSFSIVLQNGNIYLDVAQIFPGYMDNAGCCVMKLN